MSGQILEISYSLGRGHNLSMSETQIFMMIQPFYLTVAFINYFPVCGWMAGLLAYPSHRKQFACFLKCVSKTIDKECYFACFLEFL